MAASPAEKPGEITPAIRTYSPAPRYPAMARWQRIEGKVVLAGTIDLQGAMIDPEIVVGAHPLLDQAALEAVQTWRYTPALRDGEPIATRIEIAINFRLEESEGELTPAELREQFEEVRAELGESHPGSLALMRRLALALRDAGELEAAVELLTRMLEVALRAFGPQHPVTAAAGRDLVQTVQAAGDPEVVWRNHPEAVSLLDEAIASFFQLPGDPPATGGFGELMRRLQSRLEQGPGAEAGAGLDLQVVDPFGRGVPEASVLWIGDPSVQDSTDHEGRARLEPFDLDRPAELRIDHPLYGTEYFRLGPPEGEPQPLRLMMPAPLRATATVRGRLVGPVGEPVGGAVISLRGPLSVSSKTWHVVSDEAGRFELPGLAEGGYALTYSAEGFPERVGAVRVESGMDPVELRLGPGTRVYGTVRGLETSVLEGSTASLSVTAYSPASDSTVPAPEFDPCVITVTHGPHAALEQRLEGRALEHGYEIRLPPGAWDLELAVSVPDEEGRSLFRADRRVRVAESQSELVWDPEVRRVEPPAACEVSEAYRGTRLAGRVYDAIDGAPVVGASVQDGYRTAITAADGTFEFVAPEYPPRHLSVEPPAEWVGERRAYPGPATDWIEIPLRRAVGFCYSLVWADGRPVKSWPLGLEVWAADGEEILRRSFVDGSEGCLEAVPAGKFVVEITTAWGAESFVVRVPTETAVFSLSLVGAVEISVPDLELAYGPDWLDGVTVRLDPLSADASAEAIGFVETLDLEGVPPGRWSLLVSAADGRQWRGEVRVEARRVSRVLLR